MVNNKKFISIITLIIITVGHLQSQQISLSMSLEWKEKELFFETKQGAYLVPFLKLWYINNSQIPLYFFELSHDNSPYLSVSYTQGIPGYTDGIPLDLYQKIRNEMDSCKDVDVKAEFYVLQSANWIFYDKKEELNDNPTYQVFDINDLIFDLSKLYMTQEQLNTIDSTKQLYGFSYPNKEKIRYDEAIYDKMKPPLEVVFDLYQFYYSADSVEYEIEKTLMKSCYIFLLPDEKFEVEYDLTPLVILGGKYEFNIKQRKMPTYVHYSNSIFKKGHHHSKQFKYKFPKKINGYKLYNGNLNGDTVSFSVEQ